MNLKLQIEELVLEGIEAGAETAVLAALKAELTRLFSEANGQWSTINGQLPINITVPPNATPAAIGQQIGQAVYNTLTQ